MIRLSLAAVIALTLLASPAIAGEITVGYPGSSYGLYQTGVGGEFTLNDINPDTWLDLSGYVSGVTSNFGSGGITSFQTFCVEETEYIQSGVAYNAYINSVVMNGSVGPSGDPLSAGTGWLYSQFAQGTLDDYDYNGTGRLQSAAMLQNAIWWLEGEAPFSSTNIFISAVVAQFGSESAAQADGAATYGVHVLNLWQGSDPTQNRAQDQLYFMPVPDGSATLTLFGVGLIGIATMRRYLLGRA